MCEVCRMFNENMHCPSVDRAMFQKAIEATRKCLALNPNGDPVQCETAILSDGDWYTFHTHPRGVEYPSDIDIETTKKLGKEYLCIGLVPDGRTICFHESDGFSNIVCEF